MTSRARSQRGSRPRPRRIAVLAIAFLAAAASLAGCASATPAAAPRTAPNDAELTAVIRASGFAGTGGRLELGAPWVQLWTQRQLPAAIRRCLAGGTGVDACYAATPVDLRVYAMNPGQRAQLYGYYLTVLDRCLGARGYRVAPAPDRARFLTDVELGDPWTPYDAVTVPDRAAWYALSDACPPVPAAIDDALQPR